MTARTHSEEQHHQREHKRAVLTASVGHYENFPVASVLCPKHLRPAVMAIYHFARTADDIADEGCASPTERLSQLAAYRHSLDEAKAGHSSPTSRWAPVFGPLQVAIQQHHLPTSLLEDLLSAFEQDVRHTASAHRYADTPELMAYCRLSANPVGRLLLHLYGIHDAQSLQQSDQICSALQLINFWQDISHDHPRGRFYLPSDALAQHGLQMIDFSAAAPADTRQHCQALVAQLCHEARALMIQGAPLARRVPGRAGWELRLVVQAGLLILDKIAALKYRSWLQRPTMASTDVPRLVWRALRGFPTER